MLSQRFSLHTFFKESNKESKKSLKLVKESKNLKLNLKSNKESKIGMSVLTSSEYNLDLHIPRKRKD